MTDNKNESREAPATTQPDEKKPGQPQQNQGDGKSSADKPAQQQK